MSIYSRKRLRVFSSGFVRASFKSGPLLRNHNLGGGKFQKGTSFLTQEIFLFMNSLGKLHCLQGINYGINH